MKIYLGADHGGFKLKEKFKQYLIAQHSELQMEDCGALSYDAVDDFPPIAFAVAEKITTKEDLGILLCRSGSGMVIAANKIKGIRAVELYNEKIAVHAKSHNLANVIAFSGDYLSLSELIEMFETFLITSVDLNERHKRRIEEIINYENRY